MMTPLPKMASVHESTVKRAAEHAKPKRRQPYPRPRGSQHRVAIHRVKVDPRVWSVAVELAEGEPTRIEVVHATEVIVHNHPHKRGNRR